MVPSIWDAFRYSRVAGCESLLLARSKAWNPNKIHADHSCTNHSPLRINPGLVGISYNNETTNKLTHRFMDNNLFIVDHPIFCHQSLSLINSWDFPFSQWKCPTIHTCIPKGKLAVRCVENLWFFRTIIYKWSTPNCYFTQRASGAALGSLGTGLERGGAASWSGKIVEFRGKMMVNNGIIVNKCS